MRIYKKAKLKAEIENQKAMFYLKQQDNEEKEKFGFSYIASILSIRPILKFSKHRLENLLDYCLGHIMQHYCRLKRMKHVTGMRKKQVCVSSTVFISCLFRFI